MFFGGIKLANGHVVFGPSKTEQEMKSLGSILFGTPAIAPGMLEMSFRAGKEFMDKFDAELVASRGMFVLGGFAARVASRSTQSIGGDLYYVSLQVQLTQLTPRQPGQIPMRTAFLGPNGEEYESAIEAMDAWAQRGGMGYGRD